MPSPWRLQLGSERENTLWLVPGARLRCVYLTGTSSLIYQNSTEHSAGEKQAGAQK